MLNPMRQRLLRELTEPDSAAGVARRIGAPRQLVNYHLRLLEREGLVEQVGERKRRNCTERLVRSVAKSYLIDPAALGALAADPALVRDRASSTYLVASAARQIQELAALQAGAVALGREVPTLTMQSEIRFASPEAQNRFAEELANTVATLVARYHDEAAPEGRSFRLLIGSWPAPPSDLRSERSDDD